MKVFSILLVIVFSLSVLKLEATEGSNKRIKPNQESEEKYSTQETVSQPGSESISEEMGLPTDGTKANGGEGVSKPSHPGSRNCSPKCKSHEECKKSGGGRGTGHCIFSTGCCSKY